MEALRVVLMVFAFISFSADASDDRNFAVNPVDAGNEKLIALVIGNSKYKEKSLANPANDANDMAETLRELGFDVIAKIDVTQKEMNRSIVQFGEKLNASTIALFYYAGHGMQVKGKNYLIPVDAEIATENSVRAETVDVDTVLDQLNRSPLSIVILDACRNNPFERRFRSAGGGLAAIDAPKGTLIAYATSPGSVASDGKGRNGLYTHELLKAMRTPGLSVERMFKEVRKHVTQASGDTQTPWEMSSLTGEFYFKPSTAATNSASAHARIKSREEIEDEYWDEIKDSGDLASFEKYHNAYPNGRYLNIVDLKIAHLKRESTRVTEGAPQITPISGECADCPEMIQIPGKNYEMGKFEVTQGEWRAVMGNNPSKFRNCGDTCPVEQVSWVDIQSFLSKLNQKTGRQYRLPNETEWEYACYGGNKTEYCGGDNVNTVAWYGGLWGGGNSGGTPHPVGQKQANGYGLYDMSGNVWEWLSDCFDGKCVTRTVRGGSYLNEASGTRVDYRSRMEAASQNYIIGFRLARTLQ